MKSGMSSRHLLPGPITQRAPQTWSSLLSVQRVTTRICGSMGPGDKPRDDSMREVVQ
jgi:hypothetical protein